MKAMFNVEKQTVLQFQILTWLEVLGVTLTLIDQILVE